MTPEDRAALRATLSDRVPAAVRVETAEQLLQKYDDAVQETARLRAALAEAERERGAYQAEIQLLREDASHVIGTVETLLGQVCRLQSALGLVDERVDRAAATAPPAQGEGEGGAE